MTETTDVKKDFQKRAKAELAVKAAVLETRAPITFYSLPLNTQEKIVNNAIEIYAYEYENGPGLEEMQYKEFILGNYFNVIGKIHPDGLNRWFFAAGRRKQDDIAEIERELAQDALATACIHFGCR